MSSGRYPTGSWNGSTTASARKWSSVRDKCGSGRAARSSSPSGFRTTRRWLHRWVMRRDVEIVAWKDERVAPFALLQQRIGRKVLSPKVLPDAPVAYVAYDLLELDGVDLRDKALRERRALLEAMLTGHAAIHLSPVESAASWDAMARTRESSRARGVEGFMLKHRD